ncbi:MAG: choice-of-anchor K domain-containing protein [Microcoleus anatoxicus]|uniref:choice-of-anchor K domain-containing protein n=1 Tax=Microcoleus anatoxicus TaxID=2705319 RepID=UPI0036718943
MVNVNFNVWGKERIIESTPSTLGADSSALRFANPVGLLDIEEPYGTNPDENTYVIIHGYLNQGGNIDTGGNLNNQFEPQDWMSERAKALREKDPNANIILVDWEDGAIPQAGIPLLPNRPTIPLPNTYNQAAINTREVGDQLAQYLKVRNLDSNKIELMGHSLGAHVSGFAGAKYKELTAKELNRITGLDPAGPNFETRDTGKFTPVISRGAFTRLPVLEPVPPSDRLDPDDAKRVVVLHTSKTLGHDDAIGDFDIFVNWNSLFQPGKFRADENHGYANELYTELIKRKNFPQQDGTKLDLQRLYSQETGRIDVVTNRQDLTGFTNGKFGDGGNKFSLGTPEFASFVQFDGTNFSTGTDSNFTIGKLTYQNGENDAGSEPKGDIPLNITLSVTQPESNTQTFKFVVKNQVTVNSTGDAVLDGDRLLFSGAGLSKDRIKVAGVEYTLDLFGFTSDGGKSTVGQFDSPEDTTATATLLGKIVPVTIFTRIGDFTGIREGAKELGNKFGETWNVYNNTIADTKNAFLRGLVYLLPKDSRTIRSASQVNPPTDTGTTFQITQAIMAENPGGVRGSDNNEKILGSPVTDVVFAARGADTIEGAVGNDYLRGGKGSDRILGDDGNDILNGNEGDDFISGGPGNDLVRGGQGNDEIFGNDGDDILIGEKGTDRLTGGSGTDVFILRTDTGIEETNPATADWLLDFNASEGDLIGINGGVPIDILTFTPTEVNQDGIADTIIQYTETNEIFGVYTNIFGVVINTQPDIVKNALFTIPLNDPITQIG